MSIATLGGVPVAHARVQIPSWGRPWADVDLARAEEISGVQTLVIADTSYVGRVYGGVYEGRAAYRLVGGAGGWGAEVPRASYANDLGVKVATVIGDVAALVGERVAGLPTGRVGPHYVRRAGTASVVLHDLAPRSWYVDGEGVTRFGGRPAVPYSGAGTLTRVDRATGVVEVVTDALAELQPGVVVSGLQPATDVEVLLDPERLRVRVYAGARTSRRVAALAGIFDALDPRRMFRGVYEYRVIAQTGALGVGRFALQPVRAANGLGDLFNVPARPGISGVSSVVLPGALVIVAFVDADPARPVVIAFDEPGSPGAGVGVPLPLLRGNPAAPVVSTYTYAI